MLSNLVNNFSEGVDYFRYFVQAFEVNTSPCVRPFDLPHMLPVPRLQTALVKKNKQTEHLKNFFFFVPALTVSYIDAIRAAKDCMDKTIRVCGCEWYRWVKCAGLMLSDHCRARKRTSLMMALPLALPTSLPFSTKQR